MKPQKHIDTRNANYPSIISGARFDYDAFRNLRQMADLESKALPKNASFTHHLAQHLPEVAAKIDEDDFGVLHLEVGVLKLATRDAIANRDWNTVLKHYAFVTSLMVDAEAKLHDAIEVSYLGNLLYGEISLNYAKARTLLPKQLAAMLEKIERHYEGLFIYIA